MADEIYKLLVFAGFILMATVLGILALYAHTIMPALRKTQDKTFVQSFQAIDKRIINPIFMLQFFLPLVALGLALFYANQQHLAETIYIGVAFVCYMAAVVITMAVNVPLNDGIKKVTDTDSAGSLAHAREQFNESKWATYNLIRTALTLIATCSVAVAVSVSQVL